MAWIRTYVTCVVLFASAGVGAKPAPGGELAAADLGWPTSTTAVTVRSLARLLDVPVTGHRVAYVAPGTRVTFRKIVASQDACRAWLLLEPRGWACATDLAPAADTAPPPSSRTAPRIVWANVRSGGVAAYDDIDAIKRGTASRTIGDHTNVAMRGATLKQGSTTYLKTDQGWVASSDLWWYAPSGFSGVEIANASTPLDFGWAVAHVPGAKIAVRDAAAPTGAVVRELAPRDRVTIAEEKSGFARIGANEWVDTTELRHIAMRPRPDGVGATERWIDVDLDHQVLVAYTGDAPVFVTLVSTGRVLWPTPTGIFRVRAKDPVARMRDPGGLPETWDVADVPWAMTFRRNFALHGTYWHDGFGRERSHGCVNLSTTDAKRIYDFVAPEAPPGWSAVEANPGEGTIVRIRSRHDPDPRWYDFDGRVLPKPSAVAAPVVATKPAPAPQTPAIATLQTAPPLTAARSTTAPIASLQPVSDDVPPPPRRKKKKRPEAESLPEP